ncbi:MAG TPA: carboxypeptidase-like regulatory domain-containing protein, partial [Saprospiraceae bacterium]|nr:carboxypeptidase-like regulatory domain-containing protein [Saprospiraceae bacterium]
MQQQLYFLFLFFCLSISTSLSAQESNTYILGKISDKISEEGVESALVFEKTEQIGVESDQFGFYQLSVPPNKPLTIIIRRVGYDQATIKLNAIQPGTVLKVDISLTQNNMGEGVVIYAESIGDKNMVRANVQEFKLLPSVSGNVESMLPSIALGTSSGSGGELTSQYNVRGGNYDENLVYVNDFEIFRPQLIRAGQQEGLSFPNIDLIRDLSFSSGGFEARYGDKLSSVLDVKYKRPEAFKGSISGSLLGATAHLEGSTKIKKNQTGKLRYLLGARYKTTRYILGSLDAKGEYFPNFLDLQSYITYDFHPNWQLALIGNLNSATYNFTPTETEIVTGGFFFPHKFSADFEGGEKDRFNNNMAGVALNFIPQKRKNPSFVKILASTYNGDESETFDILSYFKVSKLELDLKGGKPKEIGVLGDGIQHNYARNRLQNIILNSEIKAGIEIPRFNYDKDTESSHFLHGGIKWQQEHFKDRINEWIRTDSAGYSLPNAEDEYQLGT